MLLAEQVKTGGTYIQRRRRPKRSDTDDDGLVSNVLSDFSESDGSRHQHLVNPLSTHVVPVCAADDCPVLLP